MRDWHSFQNSDDDDHIIIILMITRKSQMVERKTTRKPLHISHICSKALIFYGSFRFFVHIIIILMMTKKHIVERKTTRKLWHIPHICSKALICYGSFLFLLFMRVSYQNSPFWHSGAFDNGGDHGNWVPWKHVLRNLVDSTNRGVMDMVVFGLLVSQVDIDLGSLVFWYIVWIMQHE